MVAGTGSAVVPRKAYSRACVSVVKWRNAWRGGAYARGRERRGAGAAGAAVAAARGECQKRQRSSARVTAGARSSAKRSSGRR